MRDEPQRSRVPWLQIVLFLCTLITTTVAGALQNGVDPLADPWSIISGLPFAATLTMILLVHEMGHYVMGRHHGVKVTPPYFIPAPSFIGTFGAFIKMQSSPSDRRSLFDIGASGPLAGLALAIPAVIVGLHLSTVSPPEAATGGITLGSSLLLRLLTWLTLGVLPDEVNIIMHPIGFAGWIGLLVTSMNLLPIGQLDGGHVAYALFGRRQIWVSRAAVLSILALGLTRWWDGWLIWGLLLLLLGLNHPPPLEPEVPLDPKRKWLGWAVFVVFALTFIPIPFSFHETEAYHERAFPTPSSSKASRNGGPP